MVERYDVAEQFEQISDGGVHGGRGLGTGVSSSHFHQCLVREAHQPPYRRAVRVAYAQPGVLNTFVRLKADNK